jgi:hypothetical protein
MMETVSWTFSEKTKSCQIHTNYEICWKNLVSTEVVQRYLSIAGNEDVGEVFALVKLTSLRTCAVCDLPFPIQEEIHVK